MKKSPIAKWIIAGSIVTLAIGLAFVIALITKFSPVESANQKRESVSLFGDATKAPSTPVTSDLTENKAEEQKADPIEIVKGSTGVATEQNISVLFKTGNFEVHPSDSSNFVWACSGVKGVELKAETIGTTLTFDVSAAPGASCELLVPIMNLFKIEGSKGNIEILQPNFSVDAAIDTGDITFMDDEKINYKYDVKVQKGKSDIFKSSKEPEFLTVKLRVRTGKIEK